MDIVDDGQCFACGARNPGGLHMRFRLDASRACAAAEIAVPPRFAGWGNTVHGGIVATLLDEAMVYACGATGQYVATATMDLRFRKPVPIETPLRIEGRVTGRRARFLQAESLVLLDDAVLARARGVLAIMRAITDADPLETGRS